MMGAVSDRDMHAWWGEFDVMMADYKSKRNDSICTEEEMLAKLIVSKIVPLFTMLQIKIESSLNTTHLNVLPYELTS